MKRSRLLNVSHSRMRIMQQFRPMLRFIRIQVVLRFPAEQRRRGTLEDQLLGSVVSMTTLRVFEDEHKSKRGVMLCNNSDLRST